jgi:hypothetical protein
MPKQINFTLRPVIVTIESRVDVRDIAWELGPVIQFFQGIPFLRAENFYVYVDEKGLPVETYTRKDGRKMFSEFWLQSFTDLYKNTHNLVMVHMGRANRTRLGVTDFNGAYYLDKDDVMEAWVAADLKTQPSIGRTRYVTIDGKKHELTELQRLVIHEVMHALVHFSGRGNELRAKFNVATDTDVVHYCDYVLHDFDVLKAALTFEEWSLSAYVVALAREVIRLLTLKNLRDKVVVPLDEDPPPRPGTPAGKVVVAPRFSRLEDWAEAIKNFEDYVVPGGRYRGGAIAPQGSLSYRNNNPGNLRSSVYEAGKRNNFSYFDTYEDGWKALLHQLRIVANGTSPAYSARARALGKANSGELTLLEFFQVYAPSEDNNHPETYANYVAKFLNVLPTTQVKTLL